MSIAKAIALLRQQNNLSQSQFAEIFNVSQQSVQKWESGVSVPDLDKLVKIAKYFDVSLDLLVMDRNQRMIEAQNYNKTITKNFDAFSYWELYSSDLMAEYRQAWDEGLDIEKYHQLFTAVTNLPKGDLKERLSDIIFEIVMSADIRRDYQYIEPSDLPSIKALRKPYELKQQTLKHDDLFRRIKGAWLGRASGCMLGKAVECIRSHELIPFLKETGNYPMHRYIYRADLTEEICQKYQFDFRNRAYVDAIEFMPSDDDMNYLVLAQLIIDNYGRNFTSFDVSRAWLKYQTKDSYCTAEKVAYRNFVNGYTPPQSAMYKNPYREWIGAQIRGDYFGYINPGNPELAAEMAHRDASISHVKNGIYGEMFVASALALAAVTSNLEDIILGALAQIPATSRFHEAIMKVYQLYQSGQSLDETMQYIHTQFNEYVEYDWCHTIANAMIVVMSLLYGKGDFGKSICIAVQSAFDTDCNGATVGSILGMALGWENIPEYWYKPFNNKVQTTIFEVGTIDLIECAKHTLAHIEKK